MGTITGFAKDSKGFVWMATAEGLHRYDGKHFKIFKHNESDKSSIADSYITTLLSHKGTLYIGNHLGTVDLLDEETYTISHIDIKALDSSFDNPIESIVAYKNSIIIDTDGGGIWQYSPAEKRLRKLEIGVIGSQEIRELKVHNGNLQILTTRGFYETNLNSVVKRLHNSPINLSSFTNYDGNVLLGTSNGLYQLNPNNKITGIDLPPRKRYIKQINTLESNGEFVWIGTRGGLLKYDGENIVLYRNNQLRPYSLVSNTVSHLYSDRDGILWVGTIAGVSKYVPNLKKFGLLQYFDFRDINYKNNAYFIYEDKSQDIWVGTLSSGLIRLNANMKIKDVIPTIKDGIFESKSIRCIFEDSRGSFWIGTRDEGLFIFDKKTRTSQHIANTTNGKLKSNVIRSINEDKDGNLWIGTQYGITTMNHKTYETKHFQADKNHGNNSIYQIEFNKDSTKLILASFRGGLQFFDLSTHRFRVLKHKINDSTSLSNNNLMSLAWVNDDTLLIGTYGGGLNILNLKTETFTAYTEKDGLVNNAVYGVIYEGNGICWLSTNNGLVSYSMYDNSHINFKPVHYLQSTEYNEGAFHKTANGKYLFGGVNGINFFRPKELKYDSTGAPLYLTNVEGEYKSQDDNSIKLDFLNSRLQLDFMSLYYENPEGVKYSYKLTGYDNDWIDANTLQTANYPRLSPGNYVFQARAIDEFGNWTQYSDKLKIYVQPPLWQRWWFIALAVLLLAGLVYALFRYRTREIERAYKLQLVDSELAALRSQMNPHFIFNSLNSIQYFILKKEPREAYTYLSKFASLMRKILQNSRLKYISVADEIEWLNLYLEMEKMRMDNNLDFTIKTRNIEDEEHTNIPTMLIQPFVENSIVHGLLPKVDERILEVLISKEKNHLLCTITDNGIGRDASRIMNEKRSSKHNSAGMALTQQRLKILSEGKGNFDVLIEDVNQENGEKGTIVKLVVPIITETD